MVGLGKASGSFPGDVAWSAACLEQEAMSCALLGFMVILEMFVSVCAFQILTSFMIWE